MSFVAQEEAVMLAQRTMVAMVHAPPTYIMSQQNFANVLTGHLVAR